jgi:hypothetical protein
MEIYATAENAPKTMYTLSHLRKALQNPRLFFHEANKVYHSKSRTQDYNTAGSDFFDDDWDNLLILDACRYDVFADVFEEFDLPGTLEARESRGSATPEFLSGNIDGKRLRDTVYVTATTMLYREGAINRNVDIDLFDIVDTWEDSIDHGEFGVRPETMAEKAIETLEKYPNKRLVVHFIQPHIPFVGEGGQGLNELGDDIWSAKRLGRVDVSDETLEDAYRENLRAVLPEVQRLLKELEGRTVVTSDHGQMLGERASPVPVKEYGHPEGLYTEELLKVPWLVVDRGNRRRIVEGERGTDYDEKSSAEVDEKAHQHLRELGYVE